MDVRAKRKSCSRPKKRKYQGNQHEKKALIVSRKNAFEKKTRFFICKKLPSSSKVTKTFKNEADSRFLGYRVVDLRIIIELIESELCCGTGHSKVSIKELSNIGLSS
ncbi:hypothetical protein JTE90_018185 [Oedothorax gibbosus]|uniref:Uncharacterized protein n=1 Tax=Oedothorax gibbosus TaxID=931172 RepID=A0AAV6UAA7_9ARAC|nr:hypothetical protein JTE90_018185 [Oedothorax gibbosus]